MKKLMALVMMQLKDKLDLSFVKDKKKAITKMILSVVKFATVVALCYFLVLICQKVLGIFYVTETPRVLVFVLAVIIFLTTLSCMIGLSKTLYFADDNKVLATLPVSNNTLFVSKLLVFYFYELIRSFSLLVPVLIGFGIYMYPAYIGVSYFFVMLPVLLFVIAFPVLAGALLSVPALYVARLFKRLPILGVAVFFGVAFAVIYGLVNLISIIPENIVMVNLMGPMTDAIRSFLLKFSRTFTVITDFIYLLIGEPQADLTYRIVGTTFVKLLLIIGIEALMFALVMLVIKFFFYAMMRKNFEFSKKISKRKRSNPKHNKYYAFVIKELTVLKRDFNTALNYIAVYVAVPLLLFLLNKVYAAIDTDLTGNYLSYAFNMLTLLLPMLSSNALIAKSFSKEGRAAYIKKTKPVNVVFPLTAKFLPNLVLSVPSVLASVLIFSSFGNFTAGETALLFFAILFIHYAHVFISATLDLMNPLNEQYATSGEADNNKNEAVSTLLAFGVSAVISLITFFLFKEATIFTGAITQAVVKLFVIGIMLVVPAVYMYVTRIRVYYYER